MISWKKWEGLLHCYDRGFCDPCLYRDEFRYKNQDKKETNITTDSPHGDSYMNKKKETIKDSRRKQGEKAKSGWRWVLKRFPYWRGGALLSHMPFYQQTTIHDKIVCWRHAKSASTRKTHIMWEVSYPIKHNISINKISSIDNISTNIVNFPMMTRSVWSTDTLN
jgi:hypothetical protein